jgi:hypothetical protein
MEINIEQHRKNSETDGDGPSQSMPFRRIHPRSERV